MVCVEGKDPGLRQWVVWTREKLEKMNKAKNHESTPGPSGTEAAPLAEQPSAGLNDPPAPIPALPAASPAVIKHDWYQTESHAYVTILAKNLDPRKVHVVFEEYQVRPTPTNSRNFFRLSFDIFVCIRCR